ncbi:MAG: outer envelope protein [Burkholderiaceae bacterium]
MNTSSRKTLFRASSVLVAGLAMASHAQAATWSDTYLGYKFGDRFSEPFNTKDINKNVLTFGHASGYKYGSNFVNIDYLMSDKNDPAFAGANHGAREVYAIYRHTLDFGALTGSPIKFGPVKGVGFTAGFDVNTKNDAGYNSKKQMLVAGPTLFIDVPAGFLNLSLLQLWESNAPYSTFSKTGVARYSYDPHPMLSAAWGVPVSGLWFKGVANFIAEKGKSEFGAATKPETFIDVSLMYDMAPVLGTPKSAVQVGVGYNYWRNKFGNDASGPAGPGAIATTPNVKFEYHF